MARPRLLSRERVITRDVLREIAESRLDEAKALLDAGYFGAGVYLAGYAVECYLKVAVCFTLRWDALLATFRVHDLEGLLLYSGFDRELRANTRVYDNFAKVQAIWKMEGDQSVRYRGPSTFSEDLAKSFLGYIADPKTGVVPWLRNRVS
jgi:HEPN domain-containing protein